MRREQELIDIIRQDTQLMHVLEIARSANLPNWYIGAGIVRNSVWDYLHGTPGKTPIRDIDLVYFSSEEIQEQEVRQFLENSIPNVEWDFKNSAIVHKWYKEKKGIDRKPLNSSEEDIDNWPEICSCIGIRLQNDNQLLIYAPYDIDDLLDMVFRRNIEGDRITEKVFEWRVENKHIAERWPKAKIVR